MQPKTVLLLAAIMATTSVAFGFVAPAAGVLGMNINDLEEDFKTNFDFSPRLMFELIKEQESSNTAVSADPSIPDLVKKLGLTTLLELVVKAGLAPTLSGEGPFTVFGPTNDAFTNLPSWAKKAVSNTTVLANILKYHVLAGAVPSTSLKDELLVDTVLGKQLRINLYPYKKPLVATVQCAPIDLKKVDQKASNGLVHVLNSVMIPPYGNIVESAAACPSFKTLVTAVKAASLVDALSGKGPFTLFAPTDAAFKKLPPGTLEKLLKDKTLLTRVLEYHVVSLTYCSAGIETGPLTTLAGPKINLKLSSDGVQVNNAKVILADGSVTNGVIHAIDTVLLPPDVQL